MYTILMFIYLTISAFVCMIIAMELHNFIREYEGIKIKHLFLLLFFPSIAVAVILNVFIHTFIKIFEKESVQKVLNKKIISK